MRFEIRAKHIIDLIERVPLNSLSENDLATIRAHNVECAGCRKAFAAAQVSALLLKERARETDEIFASSPFLQTKVLAILREREAAGEAWALSRLWRNAGALASSMVATVVLLGFLTFVIPGTQEAGPLGTTAAANAYSAEAMILNQSEGVDDLASDSQVLTTLYGADEDPVK